MHQYYIIALIQQEHVPVFDNDLNTTGLLYQCHYQIPVHVAVVSMPLYNTGACSCCINVTIYYRCMFLLYQCQYKIPVHGPVVLRSLSNTGTCGNI
jgi:hypothetical protein